MNIFVTGSNGYIGSNFIKKISKKKYQVFAVTRKKNNKRIKNVKWLIGPIDKKWKELKKANILIHFAAVGGYERFANFDKCYKFNVLRSKKLIQNALKSNCKKWIIVSSKKEKNIKNFKLNKKFISVIKKKPDYVYGLTKALFSSYCFDYARKNEVKCRIIKLYHVYGGNEKSTRLWPSLINSAKKNNNFKMTAGFQKTDFNYIDDVVDGLIKSLDFNLKGKRYPQYWDMGSGKSLSVRRFAERIWKKLKSKKKLVISKNISFDKKNYKIGKKNLWKIRYTQPELTINKNVN